MTNNFPKYGNLQKIKNGKRVFSITPRIPGGFVSIQTLEKITQVAKHFGCSLKITSGQRIMINGLSADEVPMAYEMLGMDPAVLSQYSVKNVEICPGDICKRSRQNSIGLGIRLEQKFYGAPAPNRTKIGVAGCLNACGSVHSKDIGIIADEQGFIVLAGGSAGFHPRLSNTIAGGLDADAAYLLVEAIYEFYCKTSPMGEKLGVMIDRVGLEQFIEAVMNIYEEKTREGQ